MNERVAESGMPRRIHLLSNAHLDPVWLWEWEEGAAEALSTFRTAADLCEDFDAFVFNHNEALLYEWVETYEPALFARLQRLVREGRWHIMGGWYLQPDCNMPSGESFVRQILVGRRYFEEKFGARPTTAINFDPFGHTRGLVQLLTKSGYDSYLFCRPSEEWCQLPASDFAWVGYDGSEVLAHRTMNWYNSRLGGAREKVAQWIADHPDREISLVLWGVGDHGGGPSRADLSDLTALISEVAGGDEGDLIIRHATPEDYFQDLRASCRHAGDACELPRHAADINPWAVGCYTSQIRIKQCHRALENLIYSTEKMSATAAMQGLLDYPKADLDAALRALLFAEFHDILPGSSIQPVERTSLRLLDHGLEIASRVRARAFFALAQGQPQAAEGEIPVLVYNPHPFPVTTTVVCEFQLADQNWDDSFTQVTMTRDGEMLPTQVEKEVSNLNLDWRKRVVFKARLAPSRMNRFDGKLTVLPETPAFAAPPQQDAIHFTTPELNVVVNTATGLVDRYRVHGVDYVLPGAFAAKVIRDSEDPWGMQVRSFRDVMGAFELMSPQESAAFSGVEAEELPPVRVVEDGLVRTVVEAVFAYGNSAMQLRYLLPKEGTELGLDVRVQWAEKDKMLKLAVPTPMTDGRYVGQVAYGVGALPSEGDEAVSQKWSAVVDGERALTCIDDGIYGSDFSDGELRLSLLRSPAYAGHPIGERPVVPQDRFTPRIDQGERRYRFWFNAGPRDDRLAAVDREALTKNEQPFALSFFPHGGGVPVKPGPILTDDVVQLTAFKRAEDGDGYILRLYEPTGTARVTEVALPALGMSTLVRLEGFEVKTLRVDAAAASFVEVDLTELALQQ